ncbi:hypothetical protein ACTHRK_12560 [Dietzia cercidiphylli]|uniref:hypothetical protein n=1 Tax=Dietzia cercidiphylli TaxID=498199 RepID=UPI003F810D56
MSEMGDDRSGRTRRVVGIVLAMVSIAAGSVLILAHLALPEIVRLAGAGLVVVGLATVLGVDGVAADSPLTPQLVSWTLDRWNRAAPTPTC